MATDCTCGFACPMHQTALKAAPDWEEVMLDALCASDNGNNPFYHDDPDAVNLARELADAIVAVAYQPERPKGGPG